MLNYPIFALFSRAKSIAQEDKVKFNKVKLISILEKRLYSHIHFLVRNLYFRKIKRRTNSCK